MLWNPSGGQADRISAEIVALASLDRPGSPATTSNEAPEEFVDFTPEILKRLDMRPGFHGRIID